jgi:hypothetical protein
LYITPAGIASGEAFGSHVVVADDAQFIVPTGIASSEAFGTALITVYITPTGIASGEAFGTHLVGAGQIVEPTGIATGEAFGTPLITLYITPTGIGSGEAFGTLVVALKDQFLTPTGIASGENFGTALITLYVTPSGITTSESFGTALIVIEQLVELTTGIPTAEAFGTASFIFTRTGCDVQVIAFFTTEQDIGTFTIEQTIDVIELSQSPRHCNALTVGNTQNLNITGITTSETIGTAVLALDSQFISPTGIGSVETIGAHAVLADQFITPSGIGTSESVGAAQLGLALDASGIGSSESFGSAQLDLTIFPDGLVSGEAFGTTTVEAGDQFISPTGMSTSEAFGTSAITLYLDPTGIGSSESFGAAQLDLTIFPDGVATSEAFGTHIIASDDQFITPTGMVSSEVFGTSAITVYLDPTGIGSAESIGTAAMLYDTIVSVIAGGGGNYTTIQAAVNDADVTSGRWIIEIQDASLYTEAVDITGVTGTPSATNYIWIRAGVGYSPEVIWSSTDLHTVLIGQSHTRISGLKITSSRSGRNAVKMGAGVEGVLLERCVLVHTIAGENCVSTNSPGATSFSVDDCVFISNSGCGIYVGFNSPSAGDKTINVDHCSFIGGGGNEDRAIVFRGYSGTPAVDVVANVYNCAMECGADAVIQSSAGTAGANTLTLNGSHNLHTSSATTGTWTAENTTDWQDASTGGLTETATTASAWIVSDLTSGTEDLQLVKAVGAGSNLAEDNGTDRIGSEPDSRQDFSLDITGATRGTANVNIGAFAVDNQTFIPSGISTSGAFGTVVVATDEEAAAYGEEEYAAAAYGE